MEKFTPHLPLFDFFQALMQWEKSELQRSSLTMEEYEVLVEGLKNCPFPLDLPDDYYKLCRFLWFKPFHADAQMALPNGELTPRDAAFRRKFDGFWNDLTTHLIPVDAPKTLDNSANAPASRSMDNMSSINKDKGNGEETANNTAQTTTRQEKNNELTDFWVSFGENTEGPLLTPIHVPTPTRRFSFLDRNKFLPLDIRRLYQMLLTVRRISLDGERSDWNFEESLNTIIRQGYLTEFAYRRQSRQWLGLHLVLDYGGSMAAFDHFSDLMAEFVRAVGGQNSFVWYCHNTPSEAIFTDKDTREDVVLADWLKILASQPPAQILIFSDAGAARGYRNPDRLAATDSFLDKLKKHRLAWVNPMPRARWVNTTAANIANKVPMFDATDANFVAAMQSIKGKN